MGKDPVCNTEVDEKSAWQSTYQNKTYYFTSAECKADFDKDPARYAAVDVQGIMKDAASKFQERKERASSRARNKIRSMISERKGAAAERVGVVSDAFRSASQKMREQNQEAIARYADKAAANIDRISGYLQQRDADQLINEAEDFVRRRPALVIGSALAAGFLMARFLKSSKTVST